MEERHILHVAREIGKDWVDLAFELGLKDVDVERCKTEERRLTQRAFQMLLKWTQRNAGKDLPSLLQHSLTLIGRTDLAIYVKEHSAEKPPNAAKEAAVEEEVQNGEEDGDSSNHDNDGSHQAMITGRSQSDSPLSKRTSFWSWLVPIILPWLVGVLTGWLVFWDSTEIRNMLSLGSPKCSYEFRFALDSLDGRKCPNIREALSRYLVAQQTEQKLIAHYTFDGNLWDSSKNKLHGSQRGDIEFSSGRCGRATAFNHFGQVLVDGFRYYYWGASFSVSLWFKRRNLVQLDKLVRVFYHDDGSWKIILDGDSLLYDHYFEINIISGGVHDSGSVSRNEGTSTILCSYCSVLDANWHHVIVTYDDSNKKFLFYFDTLLQWGDPSSERSKVHRRNTPLRIGEEGVEIDEVKIFDKALSSNEVDRLFQYPCD